jgi:inner membrane protease ATP23
MLQQLALSKCPITPSHVVCAPCGATRSGGFSPVGGVLMCQDGFSGKSHMEDTLVHELLHVYDQCRFKVDWSDLRHHACSEVRDSIILLSSPLKS